MLYYQLTGSTAGPGTLTDDMIQKAGGYNVLRDTDIVGHRRITPELAVSLLPEIILLGDWLGSGAMERDLLLANPVWRQTPAVRDGQIYPLSSAWMTTGSQYRLEGMEAIAEILQCQD